MSLACRTWDKLYSYEQCLIDLDSSRADNIVRYLVEKQRCSDFQDSSRYSKV